MASMTKATSRTAETSLYIQGETDFLHENLEGSGGGEVQIAASRHRGGLRLSVNTLMEIDGKDASMHLIADLDPADYPELLGFERTIREMVNEQQVEDREAFDRACKAMRSRAEMHAELFDGTSVDAIKASHRASNAAYENAIVLLCQAFGVGQ